MPGFSESPSLVPGWFLLPFLGNDVRGLRGPGCPEICGEEKGPAKKPKAMLQSFRHLWPEAEGDIVVTAIDVRLPANTPIGPGFGRDTTPDAAHGRTQSRPTLATPDHCAKLQTGGETKA